MMRVCPKCGSFYTEKYKGSFCMSDGVELIPCKRDDEVRHGGQLASETKAAVAVENDDSETETGISKSDESNSDAPIEHDAAYTIYRGLFNGEGIVSDAEGLYLELNGIHGARLNARNVDAFCEVETPSSPHTCVLIRWREGECSYANVDSKRLNLLKRDCKELSQFEPTVPYFKKGGLGDGTQLLLILAGFVFFIASFGLVGFMIWPFSVLLMVALNNASISSSRRRLREAYMSLDDVTERERFDKEEERRREAERQAREKKEEEVRRRRIAENLKCPICGSRDVERIGTGSRVASVAMVGIASGKIGKQYRCKSCKHMW